MNRRSLRLTLILAAAFLACLLLLCACGSTETVESATSTALSEEDLMAASEQLGSYLITEDGYWTTDGNVWYSPDGSLAWYATYGDAWWEDYATGGDAWDYYYEPEAVSEPYYPYATDGNAVPMYTVTVSNVDELLQAIAPDTKIVLKKGEYNLNSAELALYSYCYWKPLGYDDGSALILCNLANTIITSESGDSADVLITADPPGANVLTFEDCYQVQLSGVTVGHSQDFACAGNVIYVDNSWGVYIGNCDLYGCGAIGVQGYHSNSVTVENSVIRDCSYGGVSFYDCQSVLLEGDTFSDCGELYAIDAMYVYWLLVNDCSFTGIRANSLLQCYYNSNFSLVRCRVEDCYFTQLYSVEGNSVQLNGLTIGDGVFVGGTRYYG